jgi:hypothetical protein
MHYTSYQNHLIFIGMANATSKILFEPRKAWASKHVKYNMSLKLIHGPGDNAYYQHKNALRDDKIVYGKQRIARQSDVKMISSCMSFSELTKKYSHITPSPISLAGHLCGHEFCHVIQVCRGEVYNGSVHNDEFYKILDKYYESGTNNLVVAAIRDSVREDPALLEFMETQYDLNELSTPFDYQFGKPVAFRSRSGLIITGKVLKINSKTIKVAADNGGEYSVPKSLIQKAS